MYYYSDRTGESGFSYDAPTEVDIIASVFGTVTFIPIRVDFADGLLRLWKKVKDNWEIFAIRSDLIPEMVLDQDALGNLYHRFPLCES